MCANDSLPGLATELTLIEQAITAKQDGKSMAAIVRGLDNDPRDTLAATLSSLGRALGIK